MKGRRIKIKEKVKKFGIKEKTVAFYKRSHDLTVSNIRFEILFIIAVAFIISSVAFLTVSTFINRSVGEYTYTTYDESRNEVQNRFLNTVKEINNFEINPIDIDYTWIENIMNYSEEEAKIELATSLNSSIRNEIFDTEEVTKLYRQLKETIQKDNYTESMLKTIVDNFLEEQKATSRDLIISRAQVLVERLNNLYEMQESETFLVDSTGKLLYKTGFIESLDLVKIIQKVNSSNGRNGEAIFTDLYPVIMNGEVCYLYTEGRLRPREHTYYSDLGNILGFLSAVAVFIVLVFRLTKNKIAYIEYLSSCLGEIAKGDLSYKIEVVGEDELAQVAKNITIMEQEIQKQIDAQIEAEKVKNELVTNVAHDLRTPLTSIIGYIGLVKNKGYNTLEEEQKYLEIAYSKAEKLKVIIEDLFELTKLHQQAVALNVETISISNLLNQLIEELMPLASEKNIDIETYIEPTEATVVADVAKITRVFENLVENAIKYSNEGEAIYVELKSFTKNVYVAVSNRCENIPQEEVDRFFDRFYRADKSRNSEIGGSGLGLAIAKNIVELHGGTITAKVNKDLISFKVGLPRAVK